MLRSDFIQVNDDESEEMASGIILFDGKLQHTEGNSAVSAVALDDLRHLDMEPFDYLTKMSGFYAGARMYATEIYDDDDSRYDPDTGMYIGDEKAGFAIDTESDNLPDFDAPGDGLVASQELIKLVASQELNRLVADENGIGVQKHVDEPKDMRSWLRRCAKYLLLPN